MSVGVRVILLVEDNTMGKYLHPYIESGTLRVYVYVHDGHGCVTEEVDSHIGLPRLEESLDSQFRFENFFGKLSLVYVRVILLVEVNKMGEYLHPHIELETPRVYMHMYMVDKSTKRWILTSLKIDELFGPWFHFENPFFFFGNQCQLV